MEKKKFIIILIAIFVLLAISFIIFKNKEKLFFGEKNKTQKVSETQKILEIQADEELKNCNSLEKKEEKDNCFQNLAIKKESEKYCQFIENKNLRESCYFEFATWQGKENINLCEKIENEDQKLYCKAKISLDKIYCEKMKDENQKTGCFLYLAFIFGDEKICADIKNDDGKNICFAVANLKEEFCEKILTENDKNNCYFILANFKKEPTLCDKISKEKNIEDCKYQVEKDFYDDLIKKRNENKK